jgi:GH35 family endo-1,4-beta-xylanase
MAYIDQVRAFAKANGQKMRMHALLWDTAQQPEFVRDLLTKAAAGDPAAKADLRKAITDRIQYYVRERAGSYLEIDVLNESFHQPRYLNIFGIEGIAEIFRETAEAVKAAGANSRLCVNEYNLFQWSQVPPYGKDAKGAFDAYASWYREHVEQLHAAGGPVHAIGVQYYADVRPDIPQPHSASRINGVFQNLSVAGLPISLTEFGVNALPRTPAPTPEQNAAAAEAGGRAMDEAMRLSFGTPGVTTFISWGFWAGDVWEQAPLGTLLDKQWNLTPAGRSWEALMEKWTTDVTVPASADGVVKVHAFYGDYEVTANGKTTTVTIGRGVTKVDAQLALR